MRFLTVIATLLLIALATAQEGMDTTPPKELKNVEFFIGNWTGAETFTMGGPPEKATGKIVGKKVIGGRWIQSTHSSVMGGKSMMEGMHLISYDALDKKYRAWWFDNAASQAMELEGTMTGNVLTMTSKPVVIPGSPGPQTFKATWTKKSDRQFTFVLEMQMGESWMKVIDATYNKA